MAKTAVKASKKGTDSTESKGSTRAIKFISRDLLEPDVLELFNRHRVFETAGTLAYAGMRVVEALGADACDVSGPRCAADDTLLGMDRFLDSEIWYDLFNDIQLAVSMEAQAASDEAPDEAPPTPTPTPRLP